MCWKTMKGSHPSKGGLLVRAFVGRVVAIQELTDDQGHGESERDTGQEPVQSLCPAREIK